MPRTSAGPKLLWTGSDFFELEQNFLDVGQKTKSSREMVFSFQNCSNLLLRQKIVLVIEKNFGNSRLQAENLQ